MKVNLTPGTENWKWKPRTVPGFTWLVVIPEGPDRVSRVR
jgi:hypothetical protein